MAISPNTTFVSGAILTAQQQNQFGFGIVALSLLTSNTTVNTTETTRTSVTWTAIANRYYKITWFEGTVLGGANASLNNMYLRQTTTAGTVIGNSTTYIAPAEQEERICSVVTTFTAGSQTVFARVLSNTATNTTYTASATQPAFLLVEDIGPA
jgi:hypothetical protein